MKNYVLSLVDCLVRKVDEYVESADSVLLPEVMRETFSAFLRHTDTMKCSEETKNYILEKIEYVKVYSKELEEFSSSLEEQVNKLVSSSIKKVESLKRQLTEAKKQLEKEKKEALASLMKANKGNGLELFDNEEFKNTIRELNLSEYKEIHSNEANSCKVEKVDNIDCYVIYKATTTAPEPYYLKFVDNVQKIGKVNIEKKRRFVELKDDDKTSFINYKYVLDEIQKRKKEKLAEFESARNNPNISTEELFEMWKNIA